MVVNGKVKGAEFQVINVWSNTVVTDKVNHRGNSFQDNLLCYWFFFIRIGAPLWLTFGAICVKACVTNYVENITHNSKSVQYIVNIFAWQFEGFATLCVCLYVCVYEWVFVCVFLIGGRQISHTFRLISLWSF